MSSDIKPDIEQELDKVISQIKTSHYYDYLPEKWQKQSAVPSELCDEAREKVRQDNRQAILQLINKAETRARIDELERLDTGRHYGMDYQDSLDEVDTERRNRIAHLKATLTKEELNKE